MSGSYHFYLFISNNGGFNAFKRAADTNSNNTIEFNELYNYVHGNSDLRDKVTKKDMYEIWNRLDTCSIGNNSDSTDGTSEVGSLNNDEQKTMETTITVYGKLSDKIPKIVNDNIMAFLGGYDLESDAITAATIEYILDLYNNDVNKILELINSGKIDKDIKQYVTKAALEQVKEQALEKFKKSLPEGLDYDITKDSDLLMIIEDYINNIDIEYSGTFDNSVKNLEEIIEAYMETAGIEGADLIFPPSGYEWDDYSSTMNNLQIAMLTKKYKDALSNADLIEYGGYDELKEYISEYINNKSSDWRESYSVDFEAYYGISDDDIIKDFLNTLVFDKDLAKKYLTEHLKKYEAKFEGKSNQAKIIEALNDFALTFIDSYTGTNMYQFWDDLDTELDTWVAKPLPELINDACETVGDDSELEELSEALIKIFKRAHACNIKFCMGGAEVNADDVLTLYTSANKTDLLTLINSIKAKLATLTDLTMDNADAKYPDGYVVNISGTTVFDKSDISSWFDTTYTLPEGSCGTYPCEYREEAQAYLEEQLWPTIKERAEELCNKVGIPYDEDVALKIFRDYAVIATDGDHMPYAGSWSDLFGSAYYLKLHDAYTLIMDGFKEDFLNDYVYPKLGYQ